MVGRQGRSTIGHDGQVPGFSAHVATFPDHRLSFAVMVNISAMAHAPIRGDRPRRSEQCGAPS